MKKLFLLLVAILLCMPVFADEIDYSKQYKGYEILADSLKDKGSFVNAIEQYNRA